MFGSCWEIRTNGSRIGLEKMVVDNRTEQTMSNAPATRRQFDSQDDEIEYFRGKVIHWVTESDWSKAQHFGDRLAELVGEPGSLRRLQPSGTWDIGYLSVNREETSNGRRNSKTFPFQSGNCTCVDSTRTQTMVTMTSRRTSNFLLTDMRSRRDES